jgi:hypothetical protein
MASRRIIFVLSGGCGPFIRSLPVMAILRERGHHVGFIAIDDVGCKLVGRGYESVEVPWLGPRDGSLLPPLTGAWRDSEHFWAMLGYKDPVWIYRLWSIYKERVEAFRPDLIVGDVSVEAKVVSSILGVPFVSITQSCFYPDRDQRCVRYWDRPSPTPISVLNEVNSVLVDFCLPEIHSFEELFVGDYTVVPSFPEFDRILNCAEVTYVGPILWTDSTERSLSNLDQLQRPVIFVYPGRLQDFVGMSGAVLLKSCLTALADLDVHVVVSHGGVFTPTKETKCASPLANLNKPENSTFVDWLPLECAYRRSDFVVHHGGHGSCMATFKYGRHHLSFQPIQSVSTTLEHLLN